MYLCVEKDSCEAADDSLLDLVDYCHRKLTLLVSQTIKEGAGNHDPHSLIQKADISSIEVKKKEVYLCYYCSDTV